MQFKTDFKYTDRLTKQEYVWRKYESIFKNSNILDVGADECFLKRFLSENEKYFGIGIGGNPDMEVDLEGAKVPFEDLQYDLVMCLDVLEHLEQIHAIFDECCRVSSKYFILSLPNPCRSFYDAITYKEYKPGRLTKFYGLPFERPEDRHRWFYTATEAKDFIKYRAEKNNFSVVQIDQEEVTSGNNPLRALARKYLFRNDFDQTNFFNSTIWAVLERNS